jgi:hypothetical protein
MKCENKMAGKIKIAIDEIINQRSNGNSTVALTTRAKLVLKGLNPDNYTDMSPDDQAVMNQIHQIATDFGVKLSV